MGNNINLECRPNQNLIENILFLRLPQKQGCSPPQSKTDPDLMSCTAWSAEDQTLDLVGGLVGVPYLLTLLGVETPQATASRKDGTTEVALYSVNIFGC
jgi:hypothetical protein